MRNGQGIEYVNKNKVYEGLWLNNNKTGYGNLYYQKYTNIIYYSGFFLNNKKHGAGTIYYKNNNIKLNGYWENNLLLNGTEYWENKAIKYEGSFKDDKYFGESIIYLNNGNIHYEGTFLNGYKYGNGKEYDCCNQLIYDGDWINNMKTGYGKIYKNNLLYYSGFLLNNKKRTW